MCEIEGKPSDTIELFLLPPSGEVHSSSPSVSATIQLVAHFSAGIASCFLFRFCLFNWNRARRAWFPVKCPHSAVNYFGWETETEKEDEEEQSGGGTMAMRCFVFRLEGKWIAIGIESTWIKSCQWENGSESETKNIWQSDFVFMEIPNRFSFILNAFLYCGFQLKCTIS